ncbi:MAG: ankyrin repeat domain-containing protein [Spirochaetota bacterium]
MNTKILLLSLTILSLACTRSTTQQVKKAPIQAKKPPYDQNYYNHLLFRSALQNNFITAKMAIEKGADTNFSGAAGATPLMIFTDLNNQTAVRYLIQKKADLQRVDEKQYTALSIAAVLQYNPQMTKLLLQKGAHPDKSWPYGKTVLMQVLDAASIAQMHLHKHKYKSLLQIAKLLLAFGADVQARDLDGETVLMHTARIRSPEIIKLLLKQKVATNLVSKKGETALSIALNWGSEESIQLLQKSQSKIAYQTDKASHDAYLLLAARTGNLSLAQKAIQNGANVNAKDETREWPAILFASENGHTDIIKLLIQHKVQINFPNDEWTPLQEACRQGQLAAVRLLVNAGADIHATYQGKTAVEEAEFRGHLEIVAFLKSYKRKPFKI